MELYNNEKIIQIVNTHLDSLPLAGKRLLVIIPDQTRSMPLPIFFRTITRALAGRARAVDFLIALGTHPPLSEAEYLSLVGITPEEKKRDYPQVNIFNHAWDDPAALTQIGFISEDQVEEISGGMLKESAPININSLALQYDHLLICGPVFPHEVVGFSGGNKYFFPGISGAELIDLSHWLGALITSYEIIGTKHTPVRKLIDLAAAMIPVPRSAICCVVTQAGLAGVLCGSPEEAWRQAADLSTQVHIRWMDHPYQTVLSILPPMYPELWTGAKGMYKLEPVVADGGELILYAPHIKVISVTHEKWIREIGYHVRDYYLTQTERFAHVPKGVIAHTTFLRGVGSYDPATGIERPRIKVTLATSIPEADCRALNLGYQDPVNIDVEAWLARTDPNLLVVPKAGEYLYRLKPHGQ